MQDFTEQFAPRTLAQYFPVLDVDKTTFAKSIFDNNLHTRLIISGPSGCGKTSLALLIAAGLNCEHPTVRPCGECAVCRNVQKNEFDVHLIDSVSTGVQAIRDMRDTFAQVPMVLKRRVVILDEAQRLTADGQQQLLKIMDSYPKIIFIFCTTDPQKITKAIHTRCKEYKVKPLSEEIATKAVVKIAEKLEIPITTKQANTIASESLGVPRSIMVNLQAFSNGTFRESEPEIDQDKIELLKHIINGNYKEVNSLLRSTTLSTDEIRRMLLSGCLAALSSKSLDKTMKNVYASIARRFIPPLAFDCPKTDFLIRAWDAAYERKGNE